MSSPLLVIVGETASGKTELAIRLAEKFNGEIICADSATVRRQANIGSAKPTAEEQARVRHHLIDIIEPDETFSAAQFKALALEAMDDITARGKLPIIAGGTGLYVDSVLYDYQFLAPADPALRERLNATSHEKLLAEAQLRGLDLGDVDVANKRRLIRLIETDGQKPVRQRLRENTFVLGLMADRARMRDRITRRVDAQIEQGLALEVAGLVQDFGWEVEALKAISYAQWKGYFEGQKSLENVRLEMIKANVDYAKRQRTWFRRNKSIRWLETPVKLSEVESLVLAFLSANLSD